MAVRPIIDMLVVLAVSLLSVVDAETCKCRAVHHPQQFFCRSEYVFRGKLLAGPKLEALPEPKTPNSTFRTWPTERKVMSYVFRVDEILKGKTTKGKDGQIVGKDAYAKRIPHPFRVKVYTDPELCSVRLSARAMYVIGGYLDEGRMFVSTCDWVSRWNGLTRSQRNGLRSNYGGENCQCHPGACGALGPDEQLLDVYCGDKHLYCGREGLSCKWKYVDQVNFQYNKCVVTNFFGFYFGFSQK